MRALLLAFVSALALQGALDPYAAPEDVKLFARRSTALHQGTPAKLQALLQAVFRDTASGGLGMVYDNSYTRTVEEVWRDRKANCLSLTAFYAAACRTLGVEVHFGEVNNINRWRRAGKLIRYERHMVAVVPMPPLGAMVADFLPDVRRGVHHVSFVNEARAKALFYSNRAVEFLEAGRLDEAMASSEASIQADPKAALAWNIRGVVLVSKGDLAGAEGAYRRAMEVDPSDGSVCGNMEQLMLAQNRPEEAAALRVRSLELRKKDPFFNAFLAQEAFEEKNWEEAQRRIRQALKIIPRESEFLLIQARIHLEQGHHGEALKVLEQASKWARSPEERERFESKISNLRSGM